MQFIIAKIQSAKIKPSLICNKNPRQINEQKMSLSQKLSDSLKEQNELLSYRPSIMPTIFELEFQMSLYQSLKGTKPMLSHIP